MSFLRTFVNSVLMVSLVFLIACRFQPLGNLSEDLPQAVQTGATVNLSPDVINSVIEAVRTGQANLRLPVNVPAYSFYRFDYANAAGGRRISTIVSHAQAIASPPYGVETTARVLVYEAAKAKAGYSIDFFALSDSLPTARIMPIINAMAGLYSDSSYLLESSQDIASAPLIAQTVRELVETLPMQPQADFTAVPIASPSVNLELKPDFSVLPATTITALILNPQMHELYASMSAMGLANSRLFTSNVPALSTPIEPPPNPSIRMCWTRPEHDIECDYLIPLVGSRALGSVTATLTPIIGTPPGFGKSVFDSHRSAARIQSYRKRPVCHAV